MNSDMSNLNQHHRHHQKSIPSTAGHRPIFFCLFHSYPVQIESSAAILMWSVLLLIGFPPFLKASGPITFLDHHSSLIQDKCPSPV